MNKIVQVLVVIGLSVVGIVGLESMKPIVKKDGAAPGYTGSPGDTLKNCTACHGGVAEKAENWIRSNIPVSGYVPGKTYIITAINKEVGATRFGFELSPQDLNGKLLGKMIISDEIRTKLVGDDKYITYTADGVEGQDSLAWAFEWTAPAAGTGDVTFYGGFNSNFDGHKSGDKTFLSTLLVKEKGTLSVWDMYSDGAKPSIYPNPIKDQFSIDLKLPEQSNVTIMLYDLKGNLVKSVYQKHHEKGKARLQVQLEDQFPSGNYIAKFIIGKNTLEQKVIIL